jgi:4-hydroxy-tetrahydrodipicolinate synthase
LFTGVGVALVTLFGDDGALDAKATAEHAATLVELGMRAVVVAGSTGEAATLTEAERTTLLTEVRRALPAGTPVLAGTGAPSIRQAVALTLAAVDHGADAVLALSPPSSPTTTPGTRRPASRWSCSTSCRSRGSRTRPATPVG